MSLLSFSFVLLFFCIYFWKTPTWAPELSEVILSTPPFILTFGLVWYYLSSNPDPKILPGSFVVPLSTDDDEETHVVDDEYIIKLVAGVDASKEYPLPKPDVSGVLFKTYRVRYIKYPNKLQFYFDIGNKGRSGITLHEYRIEGESEERRAALHDTRAVRFPEPLAYATERLYEDVLKRLNSVVPDFVYQTKPHTGSDVWSFLNLDNSPKKIILQETNERVFLRAKERILKSFSVPLNDAGSSELVDNETYQYRVKIYATSARPTDRITVSIRVNDEFVEWWATRSWLEQQARKLIVRDRGRTSDK